MIASMLRVADFGIQSLQMRDAEPAPSQRNDIFTNIEAIHTVQDTEGNTSSYALNMAEESDGTNSYFKLIGVVKKVLDEGTLLVADEMDAHLAEAAGPNADEALDELDRELALQIECLQEQRRTIALLKREQLDPDLPVRFARAAKTLFAAEHFNDGERQAMLIMGHLYDEGEVAELERVTAALSEKGLVDKIRALQARYDELRPDATTEDIDRLVKESLELLDPVMDCFEPVNWEDEADFENSTAWSPIQELLRKRPFAHRDCCRRSHHGRAEGAHP